MSPRHLRIRNNNATTSKKSAPGVLLKTFFSDFLSPAEIASLDVNWDKDYSMDNDVLRVFEEANRLAKDGRKFIPFAWFKIFDRYLSIPDLSALIGCIHYPEIAAQFPFLQSKSEKIRKEIHETQLKIKAKPRPDTNILPILDYILETQLESHRHFELVAYETSNGGKVESVIDQVTEKVPKVEGRRGHPGPQKHIVTVEKLWPDRGYVISQEIYRVFPDLKPFFESPSGTKFYASFMNYLAAQFPNMQDKMLDHVNHFTNRYFQWMTACISIRACLPPEVAWKYTPLGFPLCFKLGMPIQKMVLRIVVSKQDNVIRRRFFFLDEVRFVLHQLIRMGVKTCGVILTPPSEVPTTSPVTHRIAEIASVELMFEVLRNIFPRFGEVADIINMEQFSSTMTNSKSFPIISPFNSHCIPSIDAFRRLVEILVGDVGVGRRIPFTFHPFVTLMKKMDAVFLNESIFKQMVDRAVAHELIKEAADIRGKFNGKLKVPKGILGALKQESTDEERMQAFLATFRRYSRFYKRHQEPPLRPENVNPTPPGEPSLVAIHNYLVFGTEQEDNEETV